ncbi:hypothetical protein ONS95_000365 [Cadophora gregata]|uniref:uncharacterized protein n=1 Tax=Cadophora gregata TaxID=51156 RepID=UPI0026DBCE5F|nr:uncharacterized protein ONS95_000365 [Cadophora gregata]KAK0125627.1 hypothetical protein ONS96_009463 [Cadophora gregata f. sp. sojae]KAK0128394.1 hypothetical protein ONS95_000365 [Cadophora gregata]
MQQTASSPPQFLFSNLLSCTALFSSIAIADQKSISLWIAKIDYLEYDMQQNSFRSSLYPSSGLCSDEGADIKTALLESSSAHTQSLSQTRACIQAHFPLYFIQYGIQNEW